MICLEFFVFKVYTKTSLIWEEHSIPFETYLKSSFLCDLCDDVHCSMWAFQNIQGINWLEAKLYWNWNIGFVYLFQLFFLFSLFRNPYLFVFNIYDMEFSTGWFHMLYVFKARPPIKFLNDGVANLEIWQFYKFVFH